MMQLFEMSTQELFARDIATCRKFTLTSFSSPRIHTMYDHNASHNIINRSALKRYCDFIIDGIHTHSLTRVGLMVKTKKEKRKNHFVCVNINVKNIYQRIVLKRKL